MNLKYVVNKTCKYKTVKDVLKNEFNMSNRFISKLKTNKLILLNNYPIFLDKVISLNDIISINFNLDEDSSNIVPFKMNLDIVYEDEYLLIINKPSSIAIHPSILHYSNTLSNGVKYYFDSIGLHKKVRPVTRLDKDTSGIVVFAKNEYIQECLSKQMANKTFIKKYLAILVGNLSKTSGRIVAPIARKENSIIERCININGSVSITNYKLINNLNDFCLVEFTLETGRTHQIRVHCQYLEHPILGDTLYGSKSNLISRQALHCYKISFIHPISKKNLEFTVPLPEDMKKILN
jgi:23S rRNA pseudouridine1911/1915/1917 synthase